MDHNKLWNILKEMEIPDHLTSLVRNLYASQEATARTLHRTTNWFKIGKGVQQGCILSPFLFNFCAKYIMQNAVLDEPQAGVKIVGRNIKTLGYIDDTTLMAESKEELKSLFFLLIYYIYFWLCWVFVAAHGLAVVVLSGAVLHCNARVSHCCGFSCYGAQAIGTWASVVAVHRFSIYGTWT